MIRNLQPFLATIYAYETQFLPIAIGTNCQFLRSWYEGLFKVVNPLIAIPD